MTDEVFEHNPQDHEDPTAGPTTIVGALGALVLTASLMLLTALYYNVKAGQFTESVVDEPVEAVVKLHEQQEALLVGPPHWVERDENGKKVKAYVIPIEQAMQIVADEANAGKK